MLTRSARIKRGFFRLGLIGSLPLIFIAIAAYINQIWHPSGAIYALGFPSEIRNFEGKKFLVADGSQLSMRPILDFLDGPNAVKFKTLDGRQFIAYSSRSEKSISADAISELNASIVLMERTNLATVDDWDRVYLANGVWVKCAKVFSCGFPFPNPEKSHLARQPSFELPTIFLICAALWFAVSWIISWLVRGFMAD